MKCYKSGILERYVMQYARDAWKINPSDFIGQLPNSDLLVAMPMHYQLTADERKAVWDDIIQEAEKYGFSVADVIEWCASEIVSAVNTTNRMESIKKYYADKKEAVPQNVREGFRPVPPLAETTSDNNYFWGMEPHRKHGELDDEQNKASSLTRMQIHNPLFPTPPDWQFGIDRKGNAIDTPPSWLDMVYTFHPNDNFRNAHDQFVKKEDWTNPPKVTISAIDNGKETPNAWTITPEGLETFSEAKWQDRLVARSEESIGKALEDASSMMTAHNWYFAKTIELNSPEFQKKVQERKELEQKMADAKSSQKVNSPLKSEQAIDITNLVVVKDAA